jgi:hypothetical protein
MGKRRFVAPVVAAAAAVTLALPAAPAQAYHCYSDVIGDCSVVQHMLENFKSDVCLFMEKATKGLYDCKEG